MSRYNNRPMRGEQIYLAPLGSGVGDVVVALPALEWLTAQGAQTYLVARGPRQLGFDYAIPALAGVVREPEVPPDAHYINLRDHSIQRNYDWYSEAFERDYPNFRINEIMATICRDKGIKADFATLPKLVFRPQAAAKDKVILVPGTTSDFKALPSSTWRALVALLRSEHISPLILGEPDRSAVVADLIADGIPHLGTPVIQDAIDIISSSRGCISVDTGLMHIAVQQNVPTVAVFNSVHTYYRAAAHCQPVFAPACARECKMQISSEFPFPADYKEWIWWEGQYNYCRAFEQHCMSQIPAHDIFSHFCNLLQRLGLGIGQGPLTNNLDGAASR